MMLLKLALKNLLGAGLRTWLNVFVLSLAFVLIIATQGLIQGMNRQAEQAMIATEVGGGHFQHPAYDPYDPLTLPDAHGPIPDALAPFVAAGQAAPVLATQGTIYPEGRLYTIVIKGIDPGQKILNLPTSFLAGPLKSDAVRVLIGTRLAKTTGLKQGDEFTLQWRDAHGTFDALDAIVVEVFSTTVQTVDVGTIWVPLERLRQMTGLSGQATYAVLAKDAPAPAGAAPWVFRSREDFLSDLRALVKTKTVGSSIVYVIFLALAMLAIFDTQVLSIFRRRREMGTLMALGFTRGRVIALFTVEGLLNGVLGALLAAVYGIPLLSWFARTGWAMPAGVDSYGFAIGQRLFPAFSAGLVAGTTLLVLVVTAIVAFLPTRRIAELKPTDALRGRLS
jgi:ABC-type lipoprotein release transport system permease subunit